MVQLSIIIPTKDRLPILRKTLQALRKALAEADCRAEVIIISNSSRPEQVDDVMPEAKVLENPKNKNSVFCSRNYGVGLAQGRAIMLLDDDIVLQGPGLLDYAAQFPDRHPKACFNPDWIYPPHLQEALAAKKFGRYLQHHGYTARRTQSAEAWQPERFPTRDIASFCLCMAKADFEAIGGYDEDIPFEGTDHDISQRLRDAGIGIYTEPQFMVFHNEEDRQDMRAWLNRQYRMGAANQTALQNGLGLATLAYTPVKKKLFQLIFAQKGILFALLQLVPNTRLFDPISFKIISVLQGAHICTGYCSVSATGNEPHNK